MTNYDKFVKQSPKQLRNKLCKMLKGDCDVCPVLPNCNELAKKHIVPNCKTEMLKWLESEAD